MRCRKHSAANQGYTLIELSMVIVIIGLLMGAVVAGKSLIRAAQIHSLIADEAHYAAAVMAFKYKYNALPGDMPNATKFWGTMTGSCGGSGIYSNCTGTANGNGDGKISGEQEMLLVWNQLALAGLIPGKYAGSEVNGTYGMANWESVDANLPKTVFFHVYPMIWYEGDPRQLGNSSNPIDYDGFYLSGNAGNVIVYGTPISLDGTNSNAFNNWPSMYVADAMAIDVKMDDGKSATGSIQTLGWFSGGSCTNTPSYYNDFPSYTYNLTNTSQAGCALAFLNVF